MTRTTTILLLLAIALGVYIYFTPAARERAEAAWADTRTFFVELNARVAPSIQDFFSKGQGTASAKEASFAGVSNYSTRGSQYENQYFADPEFGCDKYYSDWD